MKVALASDHGGIHIREVIRELLEELEIEYQDFGYVIAKHLLIILIMQCL